MQTRDLVRISLFAGVLSVCSWISIPAPVPFTLQTLGVFLSLGLLGGRKGLLAILVYLLMGMVGLPVFAGFHSGPGALFGSTGGYLWGFLGAALVYWALTALIKTRSPIFLWGTMILGLLVCYSLGTLWFYAIALQAGKSLTILTVLSWCVFPFIVPDLLKIGVAIYLTRRFRLVVAVD